MGVKHFGKHPIRIVQKCINWWHSFLRRLSGEDGKKPPKKPQERENWENPFLSDSRQILEEILQKKGLDYRSFRPIVIDTDVPGQHFGEEDDVDQVLSQMEKGLNFLEICTDRPEHFAVWKSAMERENGLIVRLLPKGGKEPLYGNVVLDFERRSPMCPTCFSKEMIYIPIQKKKWETGKDSCLDINVPIGYNMLAVRVKKDEMP